MAYGDKKVIGLQSKTEPKNKNPLRHIRSSGLPIPRFVSLSSDKVNMRAGPGFQYPIIWVYQRKGMPMMVMAEFEHWRKVRDSSGISGWMHTRVLRGRRMALFPDGIKELHTSPKTGSRVLLRVEAGVIGRLLACTASWCQIDLEGTSAWASRADIFGILPNEEFPK